MANIINGTDTGSGGLITTGDSSDELQLQTAETARVTLTNTAVVVNEGGNDVDFRVESDTNENAFFLEGSSGNVGIGVTPSAWGSIYKAIEGGDSNNQSAVAYRTDTNNLSLFANAYYDGSTNVYKHTGTAGLYQIAGNEFIWYNAPSGTGGTNATFTERARFTSDGYLRMASGSGGIQFGGDTAAANALDDYEEGTFTPTAAGASSAGTTTYVSRDGAYTKIGNQVTVWGFIEVSNMTGTGDLLIGGLPFTQNGSGTRISVAAIFVQNLDWGAGLTTPMFIGTNSSTSLRAFAVGDNAAWSAIPVDSSFVVHYTLTYFV